MITNCWIMPALDIRTPIAFIRCRMANLAGASLTCPLKVLLNVHAVEDSVVKGGGLAQDKLWFYERSLQVLGERSLSRPSRRHTSIVSFLSAINFAFAAMTRQTFFTCSLTKSGSIQATVSEDEPTRKCAKIGNGRCVWFCPV